MPLSPWPPLALPQWLLLLLLLCPPLACPQPQPWLASVRAGDSIFSLEQAPDLVHTAVGNGYLATQVQGEKLFIAGLYTGAATSPSHRAGVASPVRLSVAGGEQQGARLHMREGVYERRSAVRTPCSSSSSDDSCAHQSAAGGTLHVEQRWYAHRVLRHVLVHEVEVLGDDSSAAPPRPEAPGSAGGSNSSQQQLLRCSSGAVLPREAMHAALAASAAATSGSGSSSSSAGAGVPMLRLAPLRCYQSTADIEAEEESRRSGAGGAAHGALGRIQLVQDVTPPPEDMEVQELSAEDCLAAAAWGAAQDGAATAAAAAAAGEGGAAHPAHALLSPCMLSWSASLATAREAELPGAERPSILTLTSTLPASPWLLTRAAVGATRAVLTVAVTSLDFPALMAGGAAGGGGGGRGRGGASPALRHTLLLAAAAHFERARALADAGVLFALHATAWRAGVWGSGIEVGEAGSGTAGAMGALTNSSLYSLLSILRADWPFGLGPGGLSSGGYGGRSFWDTESFSWQPLNLLYPELGAALLEYRLARLPGARAKARSYSAPSYGAPGSRAAMVPWESAFLGVEACPDGYATGQREIHVSGDVAVAVAQHLVTSGGGGGGGGAGASAGTSWRARVAWPLLRGIAEFWARRALGDTPEAGVAPDLPPAAPGAGGGAPRDAQCDARPYACPLHIRGVIAPTEFYACDDNTFTNGVARLALLAGVRGAEAMGLVGVEGEGSSSSSAAAAAAAAAAALPPHARPATWLDIAQRLHTPTDAAAGGANPYFAGYAWGAPVQLLDVPLLALALGNATPPGALAANIRRYLAAFEGGAAFSYAVNALAAVEVGAWGAAHGWVGRNLENFVAPPYHVWSEYPNGRGCPNFVTGAAGWLQLLVFGYAHVRVQSALEAPGALAGAGGGLRLRPTLPLGAASLTLRGLALGGHRVTVTVTANGSSVRAEHSEEEGGHCVAGGGAAGGAAAARGAPPRAPLPCPKGTEEWEAALLGVAERILDGARAAGGREGGAGAGAGAGGRLLRRGGALPSGDDAAALLPPSGAPPPAPPARLLRAAVAVARWLGAAAAGARARAPPFDPDDPAATPLDMAAARPWLTVPTWGAYGTRYPSAPAAGTCLVVRGEGGRTQSVLRREDARHRGGSAHVGGGEAGLAQPRGVLDGSVPTFDLSVESGVCAG